jgi:hypothetical protein
MAGVGLLSTPDTIKQAGWASMLVMVIFAVVCCYTAELMRHCFQNREGIVSYPDIGEAAFGKYGRVIISVRIFLLLIIFETEPAYFCIIFLSKIWIISTEYVLIQTHTKHMFVSLVSNRPTCVHFEFKWLEIK